MSLFVFGVYRISALFMMFFLYAFSVLHFDKKKTVMILAGCYLLTGLLEWRDFIVMGQTQYSVYTLVLQILLVQVTSFIISAYRDFRALFTGIVSSTYVLTGNVLGIAVYAYTGKALAGFAIQIILHGVVLLFLALTIRKDYLEEMVIVESGWLQLCAIPGLFYLICYSIVIWPVKITERIENVIPAMLVLLLMTAIYYIIVKLFSQQRHSAQLEHDREHLESYALSLKREAELMEEKEVAIVRHDMRHYFGLLESYLEEEDYGKMREMIANAQDNIHKSHHKRYCDNVAINGIVRRWATYAKEENVTFIYDIDIPAQFEDHQFEFELAAVLSNLLENAIRAAGKTVQKEGRVKFKMFPTKGRLGVEICNTFDRKQTRDKKTGFPISQPRKGHGYGLQSVKLFVDKHHAIWDYSMEEDVISMRILIP